MDDNCGEWVECTDVASGVVSRRRVWLVGEGGIYGCGCKEVQCILGYPNLDYPDPRLSGCQNGKI